MLWSSKCFFPDTIEGRACIHYHPSPKQHISANFQIKDMCPDHVQPADSQKVIYSNVGIYLYKLSGAKTHAAFNVTSHLSKLHCCGYF